MHVWCVPPVFHFVISIIALHWFSMTLTFHFHGNAPRMPIIYHLHFDFDNVENGFSLVLYLLIISYWQCAWFPRSVHLATYLFCPADKCESSIQYLMAESFLSLQDSLYGSQSIVSSNLTWRWSQIACYNWLDDRFTVYSSRSDDEECTKIRF